MLQDCCWCWCWCFFQLNFGWELVWVVLLLIFKHEFCFDFCRINMHGIHAMMGIFYVEKEIEFSVKMRTKLFIIVLWNPFASLIAFRLVFRFSCYVHPTLTIGIHNTQTINELMKVPIFYSTTSQFDCNLILFIIFVVIKVIVLPMLDCVTLRAFRYLMKFAWCFVF